jgi:peptidoglycan/LPS O-acetylase OafA/YrhL
MMEELRSRSQTTMLRPQALLRGQPWILAPVERAGSEPAARIRLHELDGLRGWSALSVVAFHTFIGLFGAVVPGFDNPLTAFFLDGFLAVCIFFVLSGEALSSSYFAGGGRTAVLKLAVKRYPRLTIPILAATTIVALLCAAGLVGDVATAERVGGEGTHLHAWLQLLQAPVSPGGVLQFALSDVYLRQFPRHDLQPFLWTMRAEMLGSIVVFALLLALHRTRYGLILVAIAAFSCMACPLPLVRYVACFLFGLIFAAARHAGFFARMQQSRSMQYAAWAMIVALGIAASMLHSRAPLLSYQPLVAVPLVFAIFCNRACSDFFANRLSRLLGMISFPLYLIQFPVLVSVAPAAILYANSHGGLTMGAIWVVALLSLASCVVAAIAFYPVEVFTRWTCDRVAKLVPRRVEAAVPSSLQAPSPAQQSSSRS